MPVTDLRTLGESRQGAQRRDQQPLPRGQRCSCDWSVAALTPPGQKQVAPRDHMATGLKHLPLGPPQTECATLTWFLK